MKRTLFAHAWRGLWYLPECGPHPGWPLFWTMVAAYLAIAASHTPLDIVDMLVAAAGLLLTLFIMIIGAVSRSRLDDRYQLQKNAYFKET